MQELRLIVTGTAHTEVRSLPPKPIEEDEIMRHQLRHLELGREVRGAVTGQSILVMAGFGRSGYQIQSEP